MNKLTTTKYNKYMVSIPRPCRDLQFSIIARDEQDAFSTLNERTQGRYANEVDTSITMTDSGVLNVMHTSHVI